MNVAVEHPNIRKLNRALDIMGGLYTAADILEAVSKGTMQMFAICDSIVVTQICIYPRRRVLHVVVAVGDIDELRDLHERILTFAHQMDVELVQAHGRRGWVKDAHRRGWKAKARTFLYQKAS